jgi:type I restriction enzyme S subunit
LSEDFSPLSALVKEIDLLPRFARTYVDDKHGIPFLSSTDITRIYNPQLKYLSRVVHRDWIPRLTIDEGMILVSCSGTIGRSAFVGKYWNGWTATQHVIRIEVDSRKINPWYLYSFLCSEFAQSQINREIHGSVVDEITDAQIGRIMVPIQDKDIQKSIGRLAQDGIEKLERYRQLRASAVGVIQNLLGDGLRVVENKGHWLPTNLVSDRLDATHYLPRAINTERTISELKNKRIGELSKIYLGPRFRRIYVTHKNGVPFLSGKNILQVFPDPLKFLSRDIHSKLIPKLTIRKGDILVTCSGTIGNTAMVWNQWNNWTASQHVLRVTPNTDQINPGYLYAFLMCKYAQNQIARYIHGSVIDEITDKQLACVLVPLLDNDIQTEIGTKIYNALDNLDDARRLISDAVSQISNMLHKISPNSTNIES